MKFGAGGARDDVRVRLFRSICNANSGDLEVCLDIRRGESGFALPLGLGSNIRFNGSGFNLVF